MKKRIKYLLPVLVIGHIASALLYLSFPNEIKYSDQIWLFNISCISAFSLWFFSTDFIIPALVLKLSISDNRNKTFLNIEFYHLLLRGLLYTLHYSEILTTDSRQRLSFLLGYVFLVSLHLTIRPSKND